MKKDKKKEIKNNKIKKKEMIKNSKIKKNNKMIK
jgi:hypothetical protein